MFRILLFLFSLPLATVPAAASSSAWTFSDGGAVRLVTSGLSDASGRLHGALEIVLKPGWKTYWRSPGDAGIPPQVDASQSEFVTAAELLFPPPERITDPYATWAGYKHSVSLPVIFTLAEPGTAGVVEGTAFLGICETICIPVEVPFSFDAGADPDNAQDAAVVEAAFAALPDEAREDFRVSRISLVRDQILFEIELPGNGGQPALFIAPPEDVQLGTPELIRREGGEIAFSAEILTAPASAASDLKLAYTLVSGGRAVAGTVRVPQPR